MAGKSLKAQRFHDDTNRTPFFDEQWPKNYLRNYMKSFEIIKKRTANRVYIYILFNILLLLVGGVEILCDLELLICKPLINNIILPFCYFNYFYNYMILLCFKI